MRSLVYIFIIGAMLVGTGGCVASKGPVLTNVRASALASEYRDRALFFEDRGEVQRAIFSWQVVLSLTPEHTEAQEKIDSLQAFAKQKAAEHYARAGEFAGEGKWQSALQQSVTALRYDPDHSQALALINTERNMIQHKVQAGETLTTIAQHYFNDTGKAAIIAYFNDLPSEETPVIQGMLLKFPQLPKLEDVQPTKATAETDAMLSQAREGFKKRKYVQVIDLTKEIVKENPYEQEAQFLLNKSLLALGNEHLKKKEYDKAQDDLNQITEGFPGRREALAELGHQKRKLAEEHYRQGVKYYLNEDLTKAIREWQMALKFYPEHIRARENIEKTQAILNKLETVK